MLRKKESKRLVAEINVVPYIDVMLVLLVIFIVTAPLLQQGVAVDLPQANARTLSPSEVEPIVVSVDREGYYYLNIADLPHMTIEPGALKLRVAQELERNKERKVLVKADGHVNYARVMAAMVLLQHAGAPSVGLVTQDDSDTVASRRHNRKAAKG